MNRGWGVTGVRVVGLVHMCGGVIRGMWWWVGWSPGVIGTYKLLFC